MDDTAAMRLAIGAAQQAVGFGEWPFAAVLLDPAGAVRLTLADTVARDRDPTAHAEARLIQQALKRIGPDLTGFTLVATTEPCPMCFTACWLARCRRLVYGTTMAEVAALTGGKPEELRYPAARLNHFPDRRLEIVGGVLRDECLSLFEAAVSRPPTAVAM